MGNLLGAFVGAAFAIVIIALAIVVVFYVIKSLGLMKMAQRRGLANPWMGWIPFADMFLFGAIADDVSQKSSGKITYFRFIGLAASIVSAFSGYNPDLLDFDSYSYAYDYSFFSFGWQTIVGYLVLAAYLVIFYNIIKDYKPESATGNTVACGILAVFLSNLVIFIWIFSLRNRLSISSQGGNPGYMGGPGAPGGPTPPPYGSNYAPPGGGAPQQPYTPPQQPYNNAPPQQPPTPQQPGGYDPTSASPYNPENQDPNSPNNGQ